MPKTVASNSRALAPGILGAVALIAATLGAPSNATAEAAEPKLMVLHLTERAERAVHRDELRAELQVEATNADPKAVQADVNQRMAAAVTRAKAAKGVTVETSGYSVNEEMVDKAPRWRGSQTLVLTSRDFAALIDLVGALQEQGLLATQLTSDLTREATQGVEDELTAEALNRVRQRAERIAGSLGANVINYRDIKVGNAAQPGVRIRQLSEDANSTAPVAAVGDTVVAVAVEAEVSLLSIPK